MSNSKSSTTVLGLATARGLVAGPAFIYRGGGKVPIPEYKVESGQEAAELERLSFARAEVKRDLENLISVLRERTGRQDVMVFECHLMILEDPMLTEETNRKIMIGHLNAEAALRSCANQAREQFARMNDPYFRERIRDLDDVERRLLDVLMGRGGLVAGPKVPSIVVASDLTPSETVQLPREFVLGFATDGGSTTSHVALLARSLGIPAVSGLGDISSRVKPGDLLLLDGNAGSVTIDPDEREVAEFEALIRRQHEAIDREMIGTSPAGSFAEGGEVKIVANLHPGIPYDGVKELGARGIGLYRSEYLWLNRDLEPTEDEQYEAYRSAAEFAATLGDGATVTIRMLDIGGDKTVKGISTKEANPFLGNRSIRYLLTNREVLRIQLRAILRASALGPVKLMYPMVSCVEELREAAVVLEEEKRRLAAAGIGFDAGIKVGMMVEVPAAALNARAFARQVDFFSIGTNDLVQYTMAMDRGNEAVANLNQPLNPAVLRLVRETIAAAQAAKIPVSVCGESAADPITGVLWAAMGVSELSMSAAYIPVMARILRQLTRAELNEYDAMVKNLNAEMSGAEVADVCRGWLTQRIPDLSEILG